MNTIKLLPGGASVEAYPGVLLTFRIQKPNGGTEAFTAKVYDTGFERRRELTLALRPEVVETNTGADVKFSAEQTAKIREGAYLEIWYGDKVAYAGEIAFTKNTDAKPTATVVPVQVNVGDNIVSVPVTMLSGSGAPPAPTYSPFAPVQVAEGDTFTVGDNQQVLYALPIIVSGDLIIDGNLIQY